MLSSSTLTPLSSHESGLLAETLGENPETSTALHVLKHGTGRAYTLGELSGIQVVAVEADCLPGEPYVFGVNAAAICELLDALDDWDCVLVDAELASEIGQHIESVQGRTVLYRRSIYHTLTRAAHLYTHPAVRRLTLEDLSLLEAAPEELQGSAFIDNRALLTEGCVAGAIVQEGLVTTVQTLAISQKYAEISLFTLEPWQRRGFATAPASIVSQWVQSTDRVPVWPTLDDNWASMRVARKVGYAEAFQRCYVIRG